jgi:hypothetical protein
MSTTKKSKSKRKVAAKAEVKAAVGKTKAPTKKAKKASGEPKPKRVSALDAAAEVLAKSGKPMRAQELIAAMAEQGLWKSPGGKTPHATLYAAMMREERDKGTASRFKKVDRGQFAFNGKAA